MGVGSYRAGIPFCPQGELVTASKAIIEKEYQPHVIVSTTGPNPFNTLTDRELEEYRREVERKQKGPEGEYCRVLGVTGRFSTSGSCKPLHTPGIDCR